MDNLEKITFDYSLKDIPLSHKKDYLIKLYDAASKFINRMRWKMFFHNKDDLPEATHVETHIFKSSKSAPFSNELKEFEKDLFELISKVRFNKFIPNFHKT